jgi:hypothetical protein
MSAMLKAIVPVLLSVALLSGCVIAQPGHLYPVQGPLAAQNPPPVYKVSLNAVARSGSLTATLAAGKATGSWSVLLATDPTASKMAAQWDAIYGQGFFVANVLGNPNFCRAALNGAQGVHLDVEFTLNPQAQVFTAKGIATDPQGNLFKLTF